MSQDSNQWKRFRTFKQRGEWVELQFMARAASHVLQFLIVILREHRFCANEGPGRAVRSLAQLLLRKAARLQIARLARFLRQFDHGLDILRVQVKSTTCRTGTGYLCQFKPNYNSKHDYTVAAIDLFAAYIIPEDVWYLIPSRLLLGPRRRQAVMLCPLVPLRKNRYSFEAYKEAWPLLAKSKRALAAHR